ncbi:hypothetical protein EW145_g5321 [Phellinidium pouzarii]|uniref:Uncharacterized protein n=1 Tax=Phellinidium pouzarii TaxID=167371 RepID=A0A4S4L286_9AGAM|nr:hypothetical protein EW145_g5321 [Phellinidium pouzarii]
MSATRPPRRLFLHLSALSDAEYAIYVHALRDLFDDGDVGSDIAKTRMPDDELEKQQIGVREVLQLFVPQIVRNELSGGQLLAAFRLLMHVRHGGDVVEGNTFVQADPSSPTASHFMLPSSKSKEASDVDPPMPDFPVLSTKHTDRSHTNPFYPDRFLQNSKNHDHDSSTSLSFQETISSAPATSSSHPPPPAHPSSSSSKPDLPSPRRASLPSAPPVPPASSKPRVEGIRAKTHSGAVQSGRMPPLPPRKPVHMSGQITAQLPPPIPIKLSLPTPTRPAAQKTDSSNSNSSSSITNQVIPNTAPLPPPPPHRVTPLMQQSLLASRAGATRKRAQDEAERTRILEVIRSSSNGAHKQIRTPSTSRSPDKGIRRPVPRPPRSTRPSMSTYSSEQSVHSDAMTAGTLEQVACARLASRARTRSSDRASLRSVSVASSADGDDDNHSAVKKVSASEQFAVPPTHPARRPSGQGPTTPGRRHMRTPSYQSYHSGVSVAPLSGSPFTTSTSSPSVSPVSPNINTSIARTTRSHSMHQTSSPTSASGRAAVTEQSGRLSPPLPPPRRRRPDSVQLTPRPKLSDSGADADPRSPFANAFAAALEKRSGRADADADRSRDREREQPKPLASLQRTFSALQARAQPTLARARYKAEAGLAPRRGFVPNGRDYHLAGEAGDRLVSSDDAGAGMDPVNDYGGDVSMDEDEGLGAGWGSGGEDVGEDTIRGRGRGRFGSTRVRDDLKLPEGEGWAPL